MATTRFNANILRAARKVGQARTSAGTSSDTNNRVSSALWSEYQNNAIRKIIRDAFQSQGEQAVLQIPEYVKESGSLVLTSGYVEVPTDLWFDLAVKNAAGTLIYRRVPPKDLPAVLAGKHGIYIPSATKPYYYLEGTKIYVLPVALTDNIIVKYIKRHDSITVNEETAGLGNYMTAASGVWAYATNEITATMNVSFSANDVNKPYMMIAELKATGYKIFSGFVESIVSTTKAILKGDGSPVGDVIQSIVEFLISYVGPDATDIQLKSYYDDAIVDLMVEEAKNDKKLSL